MRGFKHFFSIPPLRSAQLTLRGIGVQEHMPACICNRPRGTGDHLLMFFYDAVRVGCGGEPELQPPGTLMVWTPGKTHYYGNREQGFNHTWMHCDGTFVRVLLRRNRIPLNTPVRLADPSELERSLLEIHEEVTRHASPERMIVRNLLENCVINLARTLRDKDIAAVVPVPLLATRHYIETEHARPLALPELAARTGLSLSHFCAGFKKHFGAAPIEYLINHRMHRAAYLLRDQDVTISEAGQRVGYDDLYHFSKLFKKHFGMSPRHWRTQGEKGTKLANF